MLCDLAGSTALSARLDPEATAPLREAVGAFSGDDDPAELAIARQILTATLDDFRLSTALYEHWGANRGKKA